MAVNKVIYGDTTLIDLTSDTITADKLLEGYTAHDKSGAQILGAAKGARVVGTNLIIPESLGSVSGTNLTFV